MVKNPALWDTIVFGKPIKDITSFSMNSFHESNDYLCRRVIGCVNDWPTFNMLDGDEQVFSSATAVREQYHEVDRECLKHVCKGDAQCFSIWNQQFGPSESLTIFNVFMNFLKYLRPSLYFHEDLFEASLFQFPNSS